MKNKNPFTGLKLDSEEQKIERAIVKGDYKPVESMQTEKMRITDIFKDAERKDKRVSIRLNSRDLEKIRAKARENFLPYQTLIASVLHNFAQGKIKIEL